MQQVDELHLLHGPQGEVFDADRAGAQQLQGCDVDAVHVTFAALVGVRLLGIWVQSAVAGKHLRGDPLGFLFELGADIGGQQRILGAEKLLDTRAQQRPIGLRDREMAAEIEHRALADAGAAALGLDEAMGEVAFAVGGGAGLGAAYEHG